MTEFGHNASTSKLGGYVVHLDSWGAGPFLIEYGKWGWWFEDSDRFGPALVNPKTLELRANPYPSERSPFWRCHHLWVKQGRRLAPNGKTCIYDREVGLV